MTQSQRFINTFEPGRIGELTIKNRIVRSAAGTDFVGDDYLPINKLQKPFYDALAGGGVGLIIIGGVSVDHPLGTVIPRHLRLDDDKFASALKFTTDVIHSHGCPVFVQLFHAGPRHSPLVGDGLQPVTASAEAKPAVLPASSPFKSCKELTVIEIKDIINKFVDAAERAKKAGFDGFEIHASSMHLLNSFLSRAWNKRQDIYGGMVPETRARIIVEIIQETKKRLGKKMPVGVIINGAEYGLEDGITLEESQETARLLEKAGADYLHVRAFGFGDYYDVHMPDTIFFPEAPLQPASTLDNSQHGEGALVPLAAGIRQVVSIPVIAVGRLDAVIGEQILRAGKADFFVMQRRLIADPTLPQKVASGKMEDIVPCTACLHCFQAIHHINPLRCRINAAVGGEEDYEITRSPDRKRVLVVGAGPAGMEAARVSALKGHEVILVDRQHKLGGLLPLASLIKGDEIENLNLIVRYYSRQLKKLNVKLQLGTSVSQKLVTNLKPDVVFVATGGLMQLPDIPGIMGANVVKMADLHRTLKRLLRFFSPGFIRRLTNIWMPIGKNVVIIGGNIQGCEVAEFLIKRNRKITIVESASEIRDDRWAEQKNTRFFAWLARNKVPMYTGVKYVGIDRTGLTILENDGKLQTIPADTIIPVMPLIPDPDFLNIFKGIVSEVYAIGDCKEPQLIIDAIADAYHLAGNKR